MCTSSTLLTYAEGRRIVDTHSDLAMRRVLDERSPYYTNVAPADRRIYGIWDTKADEWLISDLAQAYLSETPPWEE